MGLAAVKPKLASGPSEFDPALRLIEISSLAADCFKESPAANDELAEESYYDSETGLFYNWNRYYDPRTGRYLTSDPIGLASGVNPYRYVNDNPLRWLDPLGLYNGWAGPTAKVVGLIGGAVTVGGIGTGNAVAIGVGLGLVAVAGGLELYDTYATSQEMQKTLDKARDDAQRIQNDLDKIRDLLDREREQPSDPSNPQNACPM